MCVCACMRVCINTHMYDYKDSSGCVILSDAAYLMHASCESVMITSVVYYN